ncbi:MAG: hypothetical protein QOJ20_5551 [Mycobacterium sp.]|jgi:hypothetical protein|nr:hypothetical protein [Mycobacterium sp.]MDT5284356.1 hypothetical protein [Mycobacterium sp.]
MSLSDLMKMFGSVAPRMLSLGVFLACGCHRRRVFAKPGNLDPVSADRAASQSLVMPAGPAHNGQSADGDRRTNEKNNYRDEIHSVDNVTNQQLRQGPFSSGYPCPATQLQGSQSNRGTRSTESSECK